MSSNAHIAVIKRMNKDSVELIEWLDELVDESLRVEQVVVGRSEDE